jgi:hypothetical protein
MVTAVPINPSGSQFDGDRYKFIRSLDVVTDLPLIESIKNGETTIVLNDYKFEDISINELGIDLDGSFMSFPMILIDFKFKRFSKLEDSPKKDLSSCSTFHNSSFNNVSIPLKGATLDLKNNTFSIYENSYKYSENRLKVIEEIPTNNTFTTILYDCCATTKTCSISCELEKININTFKILSFNYTLLQ